MSTDESPPHDLGTGAIDADGGRVSLPEAVLDAEVLSAGSDAYWAYESATDRIVVTRSRRSLDEHAGYTSVGSTDVDDDGALDLPDAFLAEGDERPWTGSFRGEDSCHFDTTVEMLAEMLCYALPEREHESFWND